MFTPDHGYALLSLVLMAFQPTIFSMVVNKVRNSVFSEKFMEEHFQQQHGHLIHEKVSKYGYPDMGEGRYSYKLSYVDWVRFNNAQRAHYHLLEGLVMSLIYVGLAALFHPCYAAISGFVIFFGKFGDLFYNSNQGSTHIGRRIGGTFSFFGNTAAFVLAVMSTYTLISEYAQK